MDSSTLDNALLGGTRPSLGLGAAPRSGLGPFSSGPERAGTETGAQRSFAEILSIADRGPLGAGASAKDPREVAETFVAVALVQPILAQARESGWAAPPFQPSQAEKQFGALMDAHVAREITRAARFPLVDRLARDMRSG